MFGGRPCIFKLYRGFTSEGMGTIEDMGRRGCLRCVLGVVWVAIRLDRYIYIYNLINIYIN
jgi:hypothetical protein